MHEKAVQNYENGSRYEGEVVNGIRDGKGKYYYVNGGYYEGSWKDGKMHGKLGKRRKLIMIFYIFCLLSKV